MMTLRMLSKENALASIAPYCGQGSPSLRYVLRHTAFALLLLVAIAPLFAQFSGPALGADTPVNTSLTPTTDPALLYPADRPLLIGVGDALSVHIFGASESTAAERVGLDGSIQVALIPPVPVLGLTLYQASQVIAERLQSAGMYRNPQVTVQLTDSPNQVVTVTGEMHGLIPIIGHRGLYSVLAASGQYAPTSSHTIIINRPGINQPIVVDLGTNPALSARADVPIFPGDTIVVPRVGVVYLLGAFKAPVAIPLQQNSPLTLMQATSLGGGTLFEAQYKDLRIIRTVGFERKVVKLNLMRVLRGKEPDPVLQADDILFLPSNIFKASFVNGGFGAATSVASLLLVAFQNR